MFGRKRKKPAPPVELTPIDSAINRVFAADGTQSREAFVSNILPILRAIHKDVANSYPGQEESSVVVLCDLLAAACSNRRSKRLPTIPSGADSNQYITSYGYALLSAICVDWYLRQFDLPASDYLGVGEKLIPASGKDELRKHDQVWSAWNGFFTGEADGGLREAAGLSACPAADPDKSKTPAVPSEQPMPLPPTQCGDRKKTPRGTPASLPTYHWAKPHVIGWEIIDTLREAIASDSIRTNKIGAFIVVDEDGRTFLKAPDVFEWCSRVLGEKATPKLLENRFCNLNIHMRTRDPRPGSTRVFTKYKGRWRKSRQTIKGYVIEYDTLLWEEKPTKAPFVILEITKKLPMP